MLSADLRTGADQTSFFARRMAGANRPRRTARGKEEK